MERTSQRDLSEFVNPSSLRLPVEFPSSAWYRNAPFAFWIIEAIRPNRLIELGTHRGFSYLCFCQAVDNLDLGTQCFAVDTWAGDEHSGFYGDDVLRELKEQHDHRYSGFSRLVQSTFDDAVEHFEDGSVDLLHIDGRHFYKDVKHDFETWLPKMSLTGVVLFHDINVRERDFGVHLFWKEIENTYPTFAFLDEHGLGVAAVGASIPQVLQPLMDASRDLELTKLIRNVYQRLGEGVVATAMTIELSGTISDLRSVTESLRATLHEREIEVREMTATLGENRTRLEVAQSALTRARSDLRELEETLEKSVDIDRDLRASRAERDQLRVEIQNFAASNHALESALTDIYGSRAWRAVGLMRGLGQRHPKLVGTPLRIARHLVSSSKQDTAVSDAVGTSPSDLVDRAFVASQPQSDGLSQSYLEHPPAVAALPLAIATEASIRAATDASMGSLLARAATDPGVLNPLLAFGWHGSAPTASPRDLVGLSKRLDDALAMLDHEDTEQPTVSTKVDVFIPIYNAPVHVDRCVRALYANTSPEVLGTVFLADDASDEATQTVIENLTSEFNCVVIRREQNLGYTGNVNDAITRSTGDLILLLNSDCYIGPNTVEKLAIRFETDANLGLASPLSNESPPVSLPILPGFSYNDMDRVLEAIGKGATYSACTIVGNCLMLRRTCLEAVGPFGEEWGVGYGEETDYQFRAMAKGFSAVIAADTFVYHEGAGSFGDDIVISEHRHEAYQDFIGKWGPEYRAEFARYRDPTLDLSAAILAAGDDIQAKIDLLILLPAVSQVVGGTMVAIDLASDLIARGWKVAVAVLGDSLLATVENYPFSIFRYWEVADLVDRIDASVVAATHWSTVEATLSYAEYSGAQTLHFVQGYEPIFASGESYAESARSYERIDTRVTVSHWLTDRLSALGHTSDTIVFGPDTRVFSPQPADRDHGKDGGTITVGMMPRGSVEKGDPTLFDIAYRLLRNRRIRLQILDPADAWALDRHPRVRRTTRALPRTELASKFRGVDIWVDASLHEGYGRLPAEAMACGAAVVMSDTGGGREFATCDGVFVVSSPTDTDEFVDAIETMVNDRNLLKASQQSNLEFAGSHTWQHGIDKFAQLLSELCASSGLPESSGPPG